MELKNLRILVTGADGFIGSHLTEALVRAGHRVRAFVLYNSFNSRGWLDQSPADISGALEYFAGDVRDPHGMKKAMEGCDVVMHLAALIAIPYSYHSPDAYVDTNVRGTLNVLQAARELGVARVVHTSTSEVYGTARTVQIDEEHPLQGQSPYSATKIGADQMALAFHRSFGTPVTVLRPFNTYGPRQSARAVIPATIIQLLSNRRPIRLGALHPTRDFNFIKDTVRGFIQGAASDAALGEVVNLGSNFEVSIGDTATLIAELIGTELAMENDPARMRPAASEVDRLWASNAKAARLFGWTPEYAGRDGLRRGLSETIEWFRDPANLRAYKADVYNL